MPFEELKEGQEEDLKPGSLTYVYEGKKKKRLKWITPHGVPLVVICAKTFLLSK